MTGHSGRKGSNRMEVGFENVVIVAPAMKELIRDKNGKRPSNESLTTKQEPDDEGVRYNVR